MNPALEVPVLDLSTCDQEPIRTPGSIQPHGFLLTLSEGLQVLQASANLGDWCACTAFDAAGRPLAEVLGEEAARRLAPEITASLGSRPYYVGTVTTGNGRHFDVLGHWWDGLLILEFEPVNRAEAADFRHLYPLIGDFLLKVNESSSIESLAAVACHHVRAVTGFGRVMVYQFDREGHGHVMAESLADGYHSYMGQHFPASDIPAQARELYALSRIRLIQDANYLPAPLVPAANPLTGKPNDLSFAALRSVSPVHLQYMRNMHTMASMSVSLIVKGKLWGLISCHNEAPTPVPFEKRTACEQLGQILALCIESREDAQELQFRLDLRRIMVSMLAGLTQGSDFIENLSNVFPELLRFARASGAAIVVDERILTYGDTPEQEDIAGLVEWLTRHDHGDVFHTDKLSSLYEEGAKLVRNASGLLALPISRIHKH
jgi:light-regulated signal transduction histidine kinase (bacteriophytochrome)